MVDILSNKIEIKCMKIVGENKFIRPESEDMSWYDIGDVICSIKPPAPVSQKSLAFLR